MNKRILTTSAFLVIVLNVFAPEAGAAVEGEKIQIHVAQDSLFVTPLDGSLNFVSQAVLEQIEKGCNPLKSARNIDVHVKMDRWVNGSDTQAIHLEGSALCSRN